MLAGASVSLHLRRKPGLVSLKSETKEMSSLLLRLTTVAGSDLAMVPPTLPHLPQVFGSRKSSPPPLDDSVTCTQS